MLPLPVLAQHPHEASLFEQLIAPIADENVEHARVIVVHGSVLSGRNDARRASVKWNEMRDRTRLDSRRNAVRQR